MNGSNDVCTEGSTTWKYGRKYRMKSEGIMEVGRLEGSSKGKKKVWMFVWKV